MQGERKEKEEVFEKIQTVLGSTESRSTKAQRIAELIRTAQGYRWVGLYAVEA